LAMASSLGKPGGPGQFPTHDLSTVRGALQQVGKIEPVLTPSKGRCRYSGAMAVS
jgi:hypothetical protein